MGEYTVEVWAAYAVAFVVLCIVGWMSLRALKRAKKQLAAAEEQ